MSEQPDLLELEARSAWYNGLLGDLEDALELFKMAKAIAVTRTETEAVNRIISDLMQHMHTTLEIEHELTGMLVLLRRAEAM